MTAGIRQGNTRQAGRWRWQNQQQGTGQTKQGSRRLGRVRSHEQAESDLAEQEQELRWDD